MIINNLNKPAALIVVLVALLLTLNQQAFSQADNKPDNKSGKGRMLRLNGHKFILNSAVSSPYVSTYLQNKLGVGQTLDITIPKNTITEEQLTQIKGELVFSKLGIEYQQMIKDWMAFRASFEVVGRLGTKPGSLISEGVNILAGYEFGWMAKLYQDKKFMLSGTVDISNDTYTLVNLKEFVKELIDSGRITQDSKLLDNVPVLRAGGGMRAAYAFNEVFGTTFNGTLRFGESLSRALDNEWYYSMGIAFDADLYPKQNVPLGFLLGFIISNYPGSETVLESYPKNVTAQINYTGNDDINLGLELNLQNYRPLDYDKDVNFLIVALNMRYFF